VEVEAHKRTVLYWLKSMMKSICFFGTSLSCLLSMSLVLDVIEIQ
jgi:hypothetical protein